MLKPLGVPSQVLIFVLAMFALVSHPSSFADEGGLAPDVAVSLDASQEGTSVGVAVAADTTSPTFVFTPRHVFVPESSNINMKVSLSAAPAGTVQGEVVRISGNPNVIVSSGGSFSFSTTNWQTPVVVKLTAGNDGETTNGQTVFAIRQKVAVPGTETFAQTTFTATQIDNDGGILVDQDIESDTVWDSTTTTYHVSGTVTITGGSKLTIRPGVLVELKTDGGLLANGGSLEAEGAVFWGETNAKSDDTQKNLIQLNTDSVSTFTQCLFVGHEMSSSWATSWDQYSAVIEADSGSRLSLTDCDFDTDNVAFGYRTTYGVRANSDAFVSIRSGCLFSDFRAAVRWIAGAGLTIEAGSAVENGEGALCLGGSQHLDARIDSFPVRVQTMSLSQIAGTLLLNACTVRVDTDAQSVGETPVDGFVVDGGRLELRNCAVTAFEQSSLWGNWELRDAVVNMNRGSLLVENCQMVSNNTGGRRTKYALITGSDSTMEIRNTSISGFRAGINWEVNSNLTGIEPSVTYSDNEYDGIVSHGGTQSANVLAENQSVHLLGAIRQASGTLKVTSCTILADTYASQNNVPVDGFVVEGTGRLELVGSQIKTIEKSSLWTNWTWVDAAVDMDGGSLLVDGCQFVCDTTNGRRTKYGVLTTSVTLSAVEVRNTSFSGFRAGIGWEHDSDLSGIGPQVTFVENEYNGILSQGGTQTTDISLSNLPLFLLKPVVQSSGTLRLTSCTVVVQTNAYSQGKSFDGFVVDDTGRLELLGCAITAQEQGSSWANWNYLNAAVDMDGGSLLVDNCQFRGDFTNGKRVKYGIMPTSNTLMTVRNTSFAGFMGGGIEFSPNVDLVGVESSVSSLDEKPVILARGGTWTHDVTIRNLDVSFENAPCVIKGATLTATSSTLRANFTTQSSKKLSALQVVAGGHADITGCRLLGYEGGATGSGTNGWTSVLTVGDDRVDTSTLELRESYLGSGLQPEETKQFYGIYSYTLGSVTVTDCVVSNNYCALHFEQVPSTILIENNSFIGNVFRAVSNTGPAWLSAYNNWWGDSTGPAHWSNPGGMGDPVSDYVSFTPYQMTRPNVRSILDPVKGQEISSLSLQTSQTAVELIGFRIDPGAIQVNRLVFGFKKNPQEGAPAFNWAKLSNFRLVEDTNGNGDIDPGESLIVADSCTRIEKPDGLEIRFNTQFMSQVDAEKGYILLADVVGLVLDDAFLVYFQGNESFLASGLFVSQVTPVFHYFPKAKGVLSNPPYGQFEDNWTEMATQTSVSLFGFSLKSSGAIADKIIFNIEVPSLTSLESQPWTPEDGARLMPENFEKFIIVRDDNLNGRADPEEKTRLTDPDVYWDWVRGSGFDELYDESGYLHEDDIHGHGIRKLGGGIVFTGTFPADGTYILVGSFRFLGGDEILNISLTPENLEVAPVLPISGHVDEVLHTVELPMVLGASPQWFPDVLKTAEPTPNIILAGFRFQPAGRDVSALRLDLSNMIGVEPGDIANAVLYHDTDEDGKLGAFDTSMANGVIELSNEAGETNTTGTIRFNHVFRTDGDYLITVDWVEPQPGDEFMAALHADGVTVESGHRVISDLPWSRWTVPGGAITDGHLASPKWELSYRSPGGRMCSAQFNAAGDKVIFGYDTGSAWVFDAKSNTPLLMLADLTDQVRYAGFSADDKYVIAVTRDGVLNFYDLSNGMRSAIFFSDMDITAAEPSPDLKHLLVISQDQAILLDIETQRPIWKFAPSGVQVMTITFSPNGEYVLLGASDRFAYLLDRQTGAEIRRYTGHSDKVTAVQFTGDGSRFITASSTYDRGTVNLWNVNSTIPLRTVSTDDQAVQGAAVSYDGSRIALVTASLTPTGVDRARKFISPTRVVFDPIQGADFPNWGLYQAYDPFIRLFIYDVTESVEEIQAIPLPTDDNLSRIFQYKTKGFEHWNKYLGSVCFDRQGERVLVTSYDYNEKAANLGYPDNKQLIESADNACFSLKDGSFLQSWGVDGRFQDEDIVYWKTVDFRPRMTSDGSRIFCGTEHGLTLLPREMGQPIHNTAFLNQMQGFDNSQVGSHAFYMRDMEDPNKPEIYLTDEMDIAIASGDGGFAHLLSKPWGHPSWKTRGDYNKLSVSPNGVFGAAGDFLFSMQTGTLYSNFATANIEYRSGFNRIGDFWGFVMESPGSAIRTMRTTDTLATLYNIVHTTDVPANPFKMLYHRDGRTVAAVFETLGVKFYDMPTHTPGVFCAFNGSINDAALSEDGSFLLIAGGNTVRLYDTRTGMILRSFYPQHANVRDAKALSVQFARNDNEIMIGWSFNYIEIFERVKPQSLEMTPVERSLLPGQSQAYRFQMTLEDATVLDVTPQAGTESTTFSVQVIPSDKATIRDNVVTVAEGATGDFTILAVYRETGLWLEAQAHVTIAESQIQQLDVNPEIYRMGAGAFRPFFYTARYSDGYQEDVTDQVTLSTSATQYLTIVDNQVKVNSGTPSGNYPVTGVYSNGETTLTATSVVNTVVQGTAWDRFAVTGGGDGLSSAYSPDKTRLALGFGSGGVSLYNVGAVPSEYALQQTFVAHTGAVRATAFSSDTQLVTVGEDGTLKVWNLADLTTPSLTYQHQAPITCAAAVTTYMAFGDVLGNVGVYDITNKKLLWTKPTSNSPLRSIAVDNTSVVCGGEDGAIHLLARKDGAMDAALNQKINQNAGHTATVVGVGLATLANSSNVSYAAIYSVSQDKTAKILKRADAALMQTYSLPEIPTAAMMVSQSLYVATKNPPVLWVYDNKAGALAKMLEIGPETGEIAKLLMDPAAKYFLAGRRSSLSQNSLNFGVSTRQLSLYNDPYTPSGSFQFWEANRGQYRDSAAHSYPLVAARMVGNNQLFTQCEKRTFKWNFDLNQQVTGNQRILESAYFSEPVYSGLDSTTDGRLLALRLTDRIYLYDAVQDQMVNTLSLASDRGPFSISPEGNYLATADSRTQLWDVNSLSLIREDERPASGVDFQTNSSLAGVITLEKKLCLWNSAGEVTAESETQHFPLKVLANVNGSSCLVLSYSVEGLSVLNRYTYYIEVFDSSSQTLNDPQKLRPMPIGSPVPLFTTPWGFEEEYLIEEWAFAVSNDDTAVLVGPGGEKAVRLPAGLRSIRLYENGSFAMQREFYPAYGPSQLITGAAGAAFSQDNSIIAVVWRDGYAELYRRQPPSALEIGLRSRAPQAPEVYGDDLDVFVGNTYDLRARLRYTNLEKMDVSGDTAFSITPAEKGTISNGVLTISNDCKLGDTIVLKGEFLDSTRTITTSSTLHVDVPTGTLAVMLQPPDAVAAGAQWRLTTETSGTWHNSGTSVTLQTGVYTLEFKEIEGWTKPAAQQVTILQDRLQTVSPLYIEYGHYALSVLTAGEGRGSVSVAPFELNYEEGAQVLLVATASTSSTFTGWSGDVPEDQIHSTVLTLLMNSNKVVIANFDVARYGLNVKVTGDGSVTKTPDLGTYEYGSTVTLTAVPNNGLFFKGWSGDVQAGQETSPTLVVLMDTTKTLTATFGASNKNTLTVNTTGQGSVTKNPDKTDFDPAEQVTLTAVPDSGWVFKRWTGNVPVGQETANPLSLTVSQDNMVLEAVFEEIKYPLTVQKSGDGQGVVIKNPDQTLFSVNAQVQLLAQPQTGSFFSGWLGDVPEGQQLSNPLTLTMDAAKSVTAVFSLRLAAPTGVAATQNKSTYLVTVTWKEVATATHYRVMRADASSPVGGPVTPWIPDLVYYDDTVEPGRSYTYWVVAAKDDQGREEGLESNRVSGSASLETPVVATYKVTALNCAFGSSETTGGLKFTGATLKSSVKIDLFKKTVPATVPANVKYLVNQGVLPVIEVEGDLKLLQTAAPVQLVKVSGYAKSVAVKAGARRIETGKSSSISIAALKDARKAPLPEFSRTEIETQTTDTLTSLSVQASGVVIESLHARQPVKILKASTKAYRDVDKVKTVSLGGIGSLRLLESDVMAGKNADRVLYNTDLIVAPSVKTLQSVGGSILSDGILTQLTKVSVSTAIYTVGAVNQTFQGNLRSTLILSPSNIASLGAVSKKVGVAYIGGQIGYPDQPGQMDVWAKSAITKIVGDTGVSGRFVAGYTSSDSGNAADYSGAIKLIQTKTGYKVEGEADLSAAAAALLKIKPVVPPTSQFAIHTSADQESAR